jgi:hypothetical protein
MGTRTMTIGEARSRARRTTLNGAWSPPSCSSCSARSFWTRGMHEFDLGANRQIGEADRGCALHDHAGLGDGWLAIVVLIQRPELGADRLEQLFDAIAMRADAEDADADHEVAVDACA